jgi:two-component sensor histidine kinase
MRFAYTFDSREVLEGIRRFRANVALTYIIAIGVVGLATLLRLIVEPELPRALPFTTYSLALIIAGVVGGFWPGMVALFFATIGGWYLFLSPAFSFALAPKEIWVLIMFVTVGMINITLLSTLIASILARDEHQQFLMQELQHRSLNLFSMIQAIASRSFVDGQPLSEAKELFNGRVAALARTHAMLEKNAWAGASLREIVLQELSGFPNQISVTGCDIPINTPAAQHFALILHELATNAVKYGALSCAEGRVQVEGKVEGVDRTGQFRFVWRESGGPSVTPPTRQGFGSNVLLRAAKHFGQNVEAKYAPGGLAYTLVVALNQIESRKRQLEIPKEARTFHFSPFRFGP